MDMDVTLNSHVSLINCVWILWLGTITSRFTHNIPFTVLYSSHSRVTTPLPGHTTFCSAIMRWSSWLISILASEKFDFVLKTESCDHMSEELGSMCKWGGAQLGHWGQCVYAHRGLGF